MKAVWIGLAVLAGVFVLITGVGLMLPETDASRARTACYNLERSSYTPAEKAQAEEICAELRKGADKRMGRLPASVP